MTHTLDKEFMMKITMITATAVVLTLSGCANNNVQLDHMSSKLDNLTSQVQALSTQVNELQAQQNKNTKTIKQVAGSALEAEQAAKSANERVDNMVASYKK